MIQGSGSIGEHKLFPFGDREGFCTAHGVDPGVFEELGSPAGSPAQPTRTRIAH